MRMIYTHENRFLVANARNLVEAEGIAVLVKNEFASGGLGELAPMDTWMELWVHNDEEYDRACSIIATALSDEGKTPWDCPGCSETNDPAFEICWNCGHSA